jgi:hypothetical protein
MSSKNTWLWMGIAAAVIAFIFVFERYFQHPEPGPKYLLPGFDARSVRTIEIRPANETEIRVEHTNGSWKLTEPLVYPAQSTSVRTLLEALQQLTVAHSLSEQELRKDPHADEDYGIDPPQISLVLRETDSTNWISFGRRTAPGDQVFVRIIGLEGVSVVDADLLNLLPPTANAWRETALLDFATMTFDRITVTNASKNPAVQLQRDSTNSQWGMILPMPTRADNERVAAALEQLGGMRVRQFLPEDAKLDLDAFGLQTPELSIAFGSGTNTLFSLDFGKQSTNNPGLIYARRSDRKGIVAVATNALGPWVASYELFRDRHLVRLSGPLAAIEVQARDHFSLQWQTNNTWRVMPQNFPADTSLSATLARTLSDLQVVDFEKDTVGKADLLQYGLAPPTRKYVLNWTDTPGSTNARVELDFGTNSAGKVFAQRVGEDAVYGISPSDFERLPEASWEMRERQIWKFDISDISRINMRQNGLIREIIRNGTNGWELAAGSQGIINDSAVEDTARELGRLAAFSWVAHGTQNLASFGFTPEAYQLSVELKNGEKRNVGFGGPTRFGSPYAVVTLDNEPWIFEFPPDLYSAVRYCLTIPSAP